MLIIFIGPIVFLVFLIFCILLLWLITYNGFIVRRNKARQGFATIDVQLKKRWDLIPQLVTTAKAYAEHEKELFAAVTKARSEAQASNNNAQRFFNESQIQESVGNIIALAEDYPDLKANSQFELLQRHLSEIEAQIAAARRSYNAAVTKYNTSLQTVPSNIIANIHKFTEMDLFSMKANERTNPSIDL